MKSFSRIGVLCAFLVPLVLFSQLANEESRLELTGTPGVYKFTWQSQPSRTYFIQSNEDLMSPWVYAPAIEIGNGARLEYGFETAAPRIFFRLKYTDRPSSDPFSDDFDDDGVSNWDELQAGIDPFKPDTDGDGMNDGYEIAMGLDPSITDGHLDLDGDDASNDEDARPNSADVSRIFIIIHTPAHETEQ